MSNKKSISPLNTNPWRRLGNKETTLYCSIGIIWQRSDNARQQVWFKLEEGHIFYIQLGEPLILDDSNRTGAYIAKKYYTVDCFNLTNNVQPTNLASLGLICCPSLKRLKAFNWTSSKKKKKHTESIPLKALYCIHFMALMNSLFTFTFSLFVFLSICLLQQEDSSPSLLSPPHHYHLLSNPLSLPRP